MVGRKAGDTRERLEIELLVQVAGEIVGDTTDSL
jgi:hypothetical protein